METFQRSGFRRGQFIKKRYAEFKELYPYIEFYDKDKIREIEPALIYDENGREREEDVVGMGAQGQWTTVDFKALSDSFIDNTLKLEDKITDIFLNSEVKQIQKLGSMFHIETACGQSLHG